MDGVVVVALPAGTLHYVRSLSARFDRRHPRADRMNLAGLIFALHNFAENTISIDDATTATEMKTHMDSNEGIGAAAIPLFATTDEQVAAALSPSKKLLVALFTSPRVDADAAKYGACMASWRRTRPPLTLDHTTRWLATRIARSFESTDSVDSRVMAALNHVPGLFRSAFESAVESHVDLVLATFATRIHTQCGGSAQTPLSDGTVGFYYRYHPSDVEESTSAAKQDGGTEGIVEQPDSGGLSSLDIPSTTPPVSETRPARLPGKLARMPSRIEAGSSAFLSTRSLLAAPRVAPAHGAINQTRRNKSKKSKNAVVNHAEPRVFQRVVGLDGSLPTSTAPPLAAQCSSTLASEYIAKLASALLDSIDACALSEQADKASDTSPVRLLTWNNPPLNASGGPLSRTSSSSRPSQDSLGRRNDLVAWQYGHVILYCLVPSDNAHAIANNADVRLQVDRILAMMAQTVRAMLSVQAK